MPDPPSQASLLQHFGLAAALVTASLAAFGALRVAAVLAQPLPGVRDAPTVAADSEANRNVIPPGQEALLADMLGQGAALPGECRFAGGKVEGRSALVTYNCSAGEIVIELHHPSAAPVGATRTERFAVAVRRGSPAPGMVEAVVSRIRSREGEFKWLLLEPPRTPSDAPARSSTLFLIAAFGLLAIAVLAWVRRRKRAATPSA
jgi:MYXO-CTERM domain-containing protein